MANETVREWLASETEDIARHAGISTEDIIGKSAEVLIVTMGALAYKDLEKEEQRVVADGIERLRLGNPTVAGKLRGLISLVGFNPALVPNPPRRHEQSGNSQREAAEKQPTVADYRKRARFARNFAEGLDAMADWEDERILEGLRPKDHAIWSTIWRGWAQERRQAAERYEVEADRLEEVARTAHKPKQSVKIEGPSSNVLDQKREE